MSDANNANNIITMVHNGSRPGVTFENEDALEEGGASSNIITSSADGNVGATPTNAAVSASTTFGATTNRRAAAAAAADGAIPGVNKSLSVISKQYDRDGKGYLDETEQRMRELDRSGKGHLNNSVVYDLMKDSMEVQKKMVTQRWLLIGLTCVSVILALSNMATGFAAARLAKDTEVSSTTNNLVVKGHPDQLVGTAAKSEQFTFGTVAENESERRRRLDAFEVSFFGSSDLDYVGHTTLAAVEAQALWAAHQAGEVKLRWTCGTYKHVFLRSLYHGTLESVLLIIYKDASGGGVWFRNMTYLSHLLVFFFFNDHPILSLSRSCRSRS